MSPNRHLPLGEHAITDQHNYPTRNEMYPAQNSHSYSLPPATHSKSSNVIELESEVFNNQEEQQYFKMGSAYNIHKLEADVNN